MINKKDTQFDVKIKQNINAYNRVFKIYDKSHGEIFNSSEQKRLQTQLKYAKQEIKTKTDLKSRKALDYGCGSGNITRHLVTLGFKVVAADVSENFLIFLKKDKQLPGNVDTLLINGYDLSNVGKCAFDLVATYSVLHHIPDYMRIVEEFIRVTKPGGIIYIDHEQSSSYWYENSQYSDFLKELNYKPQKDWRRFLSISNYIIGLKQILDKKYQPEGDIHVWKDDHVEWDKVEELLVTKGCSIVTREDYLLFKHGYNSKVHKKYKDKCGDMTVLIARKN